MEPKNPAIERLRGLAILLVVLGHLAPPESLFQPFLGGSQGVTLFFVISGYVIYNSLSRSLARVKFSRHGVLARLRESRFELMAFFLRRACRILPLALIACLSAILCSAAFPNEHSASPARLLQMLGTMLTLQFNYHPEFGPVNPLAPFWSLMVEEHFYLLLPFFLVVVPNLKVRAGILATAVLSVMLLVKPAYAESNSWAFFRYSQCNFDALGAGVLVGVARQLGLGSTRLVPSDQSAGLVQGVLILVVWTLNSIVTPRGALNLTAFTWLSSMLLVLFASEERPSGLNFPSISKPMEALGALSYGIYLFHWLIRKAVGLSVNNSRTSFGPVWQELASDYLGGLFLICGLTLGVVVLLRKFVELPMIRWGQRFSRKWTTESESKRMAA